MALSVTGNGSAAGPSARLVYVPERRAQLGDYPREDARLRHDAARVSLPPEPRQGLDGRVEGAAGPLLPGFGGPQDLRQFRRDGSRYAVASPASGAVRCPPDRR